MSDLSADQRGWGPHGHPETCTWVTLNCGVRLFVRREVAHLFKGFFDQLEAETGYTLADGNSDDWGYSDRPNKNNPHVWSNHAWGLAVDGNAVRNPNGNRATNYPSETHALAELWGLRWGEEYKTTPDPMHFEFMGTPADVARYPLGGEHTSTASTPAPVGDGEEDMPLKYMITPDGGGIVVFPWSDHTKAAGTEGKVLATPDEFHMLVARGWVSAYNPANDQERMDAPTFAFLTRGA